MHYDDIGEDLTGLDKNIVLYQRDVYQEVASYEVSPDFAFLLKLDLGSNFEPKATSHCFIAANSNDFAVSI